MKIKQIYSSIYFMFISLFMLLSGGCSFHEPIYETTHPNHGTLSITTNWTGMGIGISKPASYYVRTNNDETSKIKFEGESITHPELFEPGNHLIHIFNDAGEISINGTVAAVNSTADTVEPLPGWLFTAATEVAINKDKRHTVIAYMQQQVKELTLILKLEGESKDKITDITATLSGVAGAWDFETNVPTGKVMDVPLSFVKQTDGTWKSVVRLLGTNGSQQLLTGMILFKDNSPGNMPLNSDMSADFSDFNKEKKTPLSLQGEMKKTTSSAGFSATITRWIEVDNSNGTAW